MNTEFATTGMSAAVDAHRRNLVRYCQLLTMDLTQNERAYLHRRIAETRLTLDQLELGHSALRTEPPATSRPLGGHVAAPIAAD